MLNVQSQPECMPGAILLTALVLMKRQDLTSEYGYRVELDNGAQLTARLFDIEHDGDRGYLRLSEPLTPNGKAIKSVYLQAAPGHPFDVDTTATKDGLDWVLNLPPWSEDTRWIVRVAIESPAATSDSSLSEGEATVLTQVTTLGSEAFSPSGRV